MKNNYTVHIKNILKEPFLFLHIIVFIGFIFLGNQRYTWLLYDILILLILLREGIRKELFSFIRYKGLFLLVSMTIFLLYIINIGINGISVISILKIHYYLRNAVIILYFVSALRNKKECVSSFFYAILVLTSVQFIINIPLIYNEYLLRPWDIDQHNGLFGEGAHHFAGFVWLLLLLMLLYTRKGAAFIFLGLPMMFYLSALTSNRFFVFALIIPFLIRFFQQVAGARRILGSIFYVLIGIIMLQITYVSVPEVKYFVDGRLSTTYQRYVLQKGRRALRTEKLKYVLKNYDTYYFGKGSGAISEVFGFEGDRRSETHNLGRNYDPITMHDISTIMYELGLLFYVSLILLYSLLFDSLFHTKSNLRVAIIFIATVFMTFYHLILSDPRMIYTIILFVSFFALKKNDNISRTKHYTILLPRT